jgi:hypothetical protein
MRGFSPRFVCLSISVTDSHQTSDFCECFPTAYLQRRYRSGVQNFSDVPGKPLGPNPRRIPLQRHLPNMLFYHKGLGVHKTPLPFAGCARKAAILRGQIWSAHESDVVGILAQVQSAMPSQNLCHGTYLCLVLTSTSTVLP